MQGEMCRDVRGAGKDVVGFGNYHLRSDHVRKKSRMFYDEKIFSGTKDWFARVWTSFYLGNAAIVLVGRCSVVRGMILLSKVIVLLGKCRIMDNVATTFWNGTLIV